MCVCVCACVRARVYACIQYIHLLTRAVRRELLHVELVSENGYEHRFLV